MLEGQGVELKRISTCMLVKVVNTDPPIAHFLNSPAPENLANTPFQTYLKTKRHSLPMQTQTPPAPRTGYVRLAFA